MVGLSDLLGTHWTTKFELSPFMVELYTIKCAVRNTFRIAYVGID